MALFRPGPLISEIRGSEGGTTFSRNGAGQYTRQRSNPVNPNSARQQAVRSLLAALANRWTAPVTQAQRDGWDLYGESVVMTNGLGDPFYLSGFNHYIRSNVAIVQGGGVVVDEPPTIFSLPQADTLYATVSSAASGISVAFDENLDWVDEDGGHMILSSSKPMNAGRTFIPGPYRFAGTIDGSSTTAPTSPQVVQSSFVITLGQKIIVRARIARADGRLGSFLQNHNTIVA